LTLTLGYTPTEIEKIIYETKLQKFNDGRFFFMGGITRLNRNYGWYRGKAFTKWLDQIIAQKTSNSEITFNELHEKGFADLYITGTSLNHQRLIIFSRENYPNMKIKEAVRISISIPLYFQAVCIDFYRQNKNRTISVSSGSIGPKIRKLSLAEKEELIRNGRTAAQQFLKKY
jgi:NTE family protein